jgi:dual specificity phosphatase 12
MTFRVAIVGAHAVRVAKVLSLVIEQYGDQEDEVEFLPLVASFGSYEDEDGAAVKYLANVTYHGSDGRQKGTSIAPFFDEQDEANVKGPPIAIVAIGIGIEDEKDIQQIRTFLSTLGGSLEEVILEGIRPNPEYVTMKEETEAFVKLDSDGKREATEQQIIGPGKMAKFVLDLLAMTKISQVEEAEVESNDEVQVEEEPIEEDFHEIDESKTRYACRICRQILCGDDDLQDPPHVPAQHQFSYRQQLLFDGSKCQNLFLGSALHWMGDISAAEGRFCCPYCSAKLGIWKWAGTQCSCGTWVTPAIQIPTSKVDVVSPRL